MRQVVLGYRVADAAEDGKSCVGEATGTVEGSGLGSTPASDIPYIPYAAAMANHYAADAVNYADTDVHVNAGGFFEAYHSTIADLAFHGLSETFGGSGDEYLLAWCSLADILPVDSFGNVHYAADNATYEANHDVASGWGAKINLAFFDSNDEKNSINLYHSTANTMRLRLRLTPQAVTDEIFDATDYISGTSETWDVQDNTAPMYDTINAGVTIAGTTGVDAGLAMLFHPFKNGHYRIDVLSSFCDAPLTLRLDGHANNTGDSLRLQALQCGQTQLYANGLIKLGTEFDAGNFKTVAEQLWSENQGVSKSMPTLEVSTVQKIKLNDALTGSSGVQVGFGETVSATLLDDKYFTFASPQPIYAQNGTTILLDLVGVFYITSTYKVAFVFKKSTSSLLSGLADTSGTEATDDQTTIESIIPEGFEAVSNGKTINRQTFIDLGMNYDLYDTSFAGNDVVWIRTKDPTVASDGFEWVDATEYDITIGVTDPNAASGGGFDILDTLNDDSTFNALFGN